MWNCIHIFIFINEAHLYIYTYIYCMYVGECACLCVCVCGYYTQQLRKWHMVSLKTWPTLLLTPPPPPTPPLIPPPPPSLFLPPPRLTNSSSTVKGKNIVHFDSKKKSRGHNSVFNGWSRVGEKGERWRVPKYFLIVCTNSHFFILIICWLVILVRSEILRR